MGWSEQYWEDVKAELVQPLAEPEPQREPEPAAEDETPRAPDWSTDASVDSSI